MYQLTKPPIPDSMRVKLEGRPLSFLIIVIGVATDYVSTCIGLGSGFMETHPHYHPIIALAIFWDAMTILFFALPRGKWWDGAIHFIAAWSLLGAFNNLMVLTGVFSGLKI